MIIRVFDGGEGWIRGGTADRSRESGVSVPFEMGLEDGEMGGEVFCWADMVVGNISKGMREEFRDVCSR